MKKLFSILLLAALSLAPLGTKAQNSPVFLASATTVNANVSYGNNYFYVSLTSNITTFGFTSATADPIEPQTVTVIFAQDATGSRTVGYATNVKGAPTVNSTASSYTCIKFTYDSVSQLWYGVVVAHS